jgi:transcriptional regulator with XRE-family HTH domain
MRSSPKYGRFRALLRKIREEAGFSQADLAERLARAQTFVSKSELGERRIDFLETLEFCAACGISVESFVARLKDPIDTGSTRRKRKSPRRMDRQGRPTRR